MLRLSRLNRLSADELNKALALIEANPEAKAVYDAIFNTSGAAFAGYYKLKRMVNGLTRKHNRDFDILADWIHRAETRFCERALTELCRKVLNDAE